MSSSLNRLELAYNPDQDRLVLILYSQDFNEYLFWITRRGTVVLWDVLTKLLKASQKSEVQHAREREEWSEKIQQEKAQKQPVAEKLATKMHLRPFGDEPVLLAKIAAQPADGGNFVMRLDGVNGKWIEFGGNSSIVMALCQLMLETVKQADWSLNLQLPTKTH